MKRRQRRLWSSLKATAAAAAARTRQVLTTDPGRDDGEDPAERARARELADAARGFRAGEAKRAQLRGYMLGPGAASDPLARSAYADLCDRAAAGDWDEIRATLESELGAPVTELFDHIAEEPMASASLGQVHEARLGDRELAVKVQFAGAREALAGDLEDAGLVAELGGVPAGAGFGAEAQQAFAALVARETDYRVEAEGLQRFGRAFADDPVLRIPAPVMERTSTRVLTMERLRGGRLVDVAREGGEAARRAAAEALLRFHWASTLGHGLVNGDPNPGNFLIGASEPAAIGVVDFGLWTEVDADVLRCERELWGGLLMEDQVRGVERFRTALVRSGLASVAAMGSPNQAAWEAEVAAPVQQSRFRFTPEYAARLSELTSNMLRLGELSLNAELVLVWRARLGIAALLGALDVELGARDILRAALGDAPKF